MRLRTHVNHLFEALDNFPYVENRQIEFHERPPDALFIKGSVSFTDGSLLLLKEFLVKNGSKLEVVKYGYHYQDRKGGLVIRYDNALDPVARNLSTWPHHRHTTKGIEASHRPDIDELLEEICLLMVK